MSTKRNIRLIGLDLDETTLNHNKEITPGVRAAIENAIKAGIIVMPATGRALSSVNADFLAIPGVRYALVANGARVYDLAEKKVLFADCFSQEDALDIIRTCQSFSTNISAFVGNMVYSQVMNMAELRKNYDEALIRYLRQSRNEVEDLVETVKKTGDVVDKITMIFTDLDERARTRAALEARGGCTVTSSLGMNLEVNTATANKGAALIRLGGLLGIPREEIMAVGDSSNDLEMLKAVGYGVAMGNATDKVKAVADDVTTTCEEDGVAVAIGWVMPN